MEALWAIVCAVRLAGPANARAWSAFGFGAFALGVVIIAAARLLIARRLMQESDPPRDFSSAWGIEAPKVPLGKDRGATRVWIVGFAIAVLGVCTILMSFVQADVLCTR